MNAAQELAGLCALDDAVVVGARERHDLRHGVPDDRLRRCALPVRRVLHRSDPDDAPLSFHQAGDRMVGADRSRVGQRDRGAGEVRDLEFAAAGTPDHVFVGGPKSGEVHPLGTLDVRNKQLPRAIVFREVDRQAEVHVFVAEHGGLAIHLSEAVTHLGHRCHRSHHREADDVGERHFAASPARQVVVDHHPVIHQQLHRHRSHAGGGGHREAGLHVRHHATGRSAKHLWFNHGRIGAVRGRWSGGVRRRRRRGR